MAEHTKENGASAIKDREPIKNPMEEETPKAAVPQPQVTPPVGADTAGAAAKKPNRSKALIIAAAVVAVGGFFGYRVWSFGQTHASTDDAYVVADMVQVSPRVSGTLVDVLVKDNDVVKQGQLIARIDDRDYKVAVANAQANLDAAIASAKGAGVSVDLTSQTGNAQIQQAQGVVGQAESSVVGARTDVAKANAGIANAQAGQSSADANIRSAESAVQSAKSAKARSQAQLKAAQAVVASAEAQVRASDANVATAQSTANLAAKEAQRYASLVEAGAVSQQEADAKASAAQTSAANLDAAKQQAAAARANLAQQQANVVSAQEAITTANAGIAQAQAAVTASRSQKHATDAGFQEAIAERQAAEEAVKTAQARAAQALGQLAQAQTTGTQVDVSKASRLQAIAKVEQARAALATAKLNDRYTDIFAPMAGRISKKNIDPGTFVQPGTPMLTIVNENDVWVEANFKETQMPGIEVGKKVEVDVDAVPGHTFSAVVQSIQAGTGSTFALLPADNASGNFTKVVQRIPVKITFDADQKGLDLLRSGMSVNATVTLK